MCFLYNRKRLLENKARRKCPQVIAMCHTLMICSRDKIEFPLAFSYAAKLKTREERGRQRVGAKRKGREEEKGEREKGGREKGEGEKGKE